MADPSPKQRLEQWLQTYYPEDSDVRNLTTRFAEGLRDAGIAIYRSSMWLPTAHPELWGTQTIWTETGGCKVVLRPHDITETPTYLNTPGEAVHTARVPLRYRLDVPDEQVAYPILLEFKGEGATDYLLVPFHTDHAHEQPWIALATRAEGGFSNADVQTLLDLCVLLGWKARVAIAEGTTRSLLRVYLGPNAAERVIGGEFRRGGGQEIESVVWFCDLRGFTQLGDSMPAPELVKLLDRYFECVAGPIEDAGGEILKFVGDAVLAVFPCNEHLGVVAERALEAARAALRALAAWPEQGREALQMGISLHLGRVFYGNVGGRSRLDFTVIGSTVNEAARVESLCKDLGVPLLVTKRLAQALPPERLIALGKRSLRGVRQEQELFTLPEFATA